MDSGKGDPISSNPGDDIIREVMAAYGEIPGSPGPILLELSGAVQAEGSSESTLAHRKMQGETCLALAIGQILY